MMVHRNSINAVAQKDSSLRHERSGEPGSAESLFISSTYALPHACCKFDDALVDDEPVIVGKNDL